MAPKWATEVGLSPKTVVRIRAEAELKPNRTVFEASNDPRFVGSIEDIVGLFLDPPGCAIALCVEEESWGCFSTHPGAPSRSASKRRSQ